MQPTVALPAVPVAMCCAPIGFFAGLIGVFPMAIAPLRKLVERHIPNRVTFVVLYGLLFFILGYLFWTRVFAKPLDPQDDYWANVDTVATNELWLRQLIPPLTAHPCFTGQAASCQIADNLPFVYGQPSLANFGMYIATSLAGAIGAGFGLLLLTRPKQNLGASSSISQSLIRLFILALIIIIVFGCLLLWYGYSAEKQQIATTQAVSTQQ